MVIVGWIALPLGVHGRLSVRVLDTFGPYGPALAPGAPVQESDQPAITDDRLINESGHRSFFRVAK